MKIYLYLYIQNDALKGLIVFRLLYMHFQADLTVRKSSRGTFPSRVNLSVTSLYFIARTLGK